MSFDRVSVNVVHASYSAPFSLVTNKDRDAVAGHTEEQWQIVRQILHSYMRSEENRTLATYFILAMKENKLFDIIDARIRDGCKLDQVTKVAKIAKRCLNLKGKKRPNMREVSMELERIRSYLGDMQPHEYVSDTEEEKEERVVDINIGSDSLTNVNVTAPASQYNIGTLSLSCLEVEPLFPFQTK